MISVCCDRRSSRAALLALRDEIAAPSFAPLIMKTADELRLIFLDRGHGEKNVGRVQAEKLCEALCRPVVFSLIAPAAVPATPAQPARARARRDRSRAIGRGFIQVRYLREEQGRLRKKFRRQFAAAVRPLHSQRHPEKRARSPARPRARRRIFSSRSLAFFPLRREPLSTRLYPAASTISLYGSMRRFPAFARALSTKTRSSTAAEAGAGRLRRAADLRLSFCLGRLAAPNR